MIYQSQGRTSQWNKACEELRRHQLQLDKVIFGLTTQSSSSSSSNSSSSDEEEQPKVKDLPVKNVKLKRKAEKSVKAEIHIEIDNKDFDLKHDEKEHSEEEPVKRKRGRPPSLEKKSTPPKKVIKKPLPIKKPSPEIVVEKRPRGRPRKVIESIADNTPVKPSKTKNKTSKENSSLSEGVKTTKSASPTKIKSPVKESEVDENITSTTEKLKNTDVVEDETVSSSCQDLVRSVKVQTKPISKKPPKSYINKVSSIIYKFIVQNY